MGDLSIDLMGMHFKNPIWLGASDATRSDGNNVESAIASGAGAVVLKSVTDLSDFQKSAITRFLLLDGKQEPAQGQPHGTYTFFSRGGPMQSIEKVIEQFPEWKREAEKRDVRLIGNVSAGTIEGWKKLSVKLADVGVDALELNFGNPHARFSTHTMGMKISQSSNLASEIVRTVVESVGIPIIVKTSPQVPDLKALVKSVHKAGAVGVTVMHRFQGLMMDAETGRPVFNGYNGIGGPWMKPLALYWISQIYNGTNSPVIGGNGIDCWEDVVEFILSGASAVQISSSVMVRGYGLVEKILAGLDVYMRRKNVTRLAELTGKGAQYLNDNESVTFPERKLEVNSKICVNCDTKPCQDACFYDALSFDEGIPAINDKCNGCGMCTFQCPLGSLTFNN